jgi:hypothetical protein
MHSLTLLTILFFPSFMATETTTSQSIVIDVINTILTAHEDFKKDSEFNETNFAKIEFLYMFLKHTEVVKVLEELVFI